MQVSSNPPLSLRESFSSSSVFQFSEVTQDIEDDFSLKLDINEDAVEEKQSKLEGEDDANEDEEEEFSFVCMNPDGSPISADDIFEDGQIRPFYPLFDKDLRQQLEKVFVEGLDGDCGSSVSSSEAEDPEGLHCPWTKKAVDDSGKACRKSNSTGFSKLRRFREMILRSTSDGKDAFVFLHHHDHHSHDKSGASVIAIAKPAEKREKVTEGKKNSQSKRPPAPKSAHERLYVQNRATKEEHKRKSYLPYRVGFFTRNVHPY